MIKENELRVGNIVYCKGIIDKVLTVGHNDFYTEKHYHGIVNEDLNPIPITEEILLKCGFKNIDTIAELWINGHCLEINKQASYYNSTDIKHIQYLHQLQNLYFALTGEELNISL